MNKKNEIYITVPFIFAFLLFSIYNNNTFAQSPAAAPSSIEGIKVYDPNLKIELVANGFDFPTTMAFLGPNDFLILEKSGAVKRVTDGVIVEKPLIEVNASLKDERGLLGIAVSQLKNPISQVSTQEDPKITHNIFLYYVECKNHSLECSNNIYRYQMDIKNNVLINPKLLLSIPSFPDPSHIGGIIRIGHDDNLYVTVGSFQNTGVPPTIKNKALNFEDGNNFDGRGGILRITQEGKPVNDGGGNIIGDTYPLNLYYAYGIRNSFGLDFDPLTGKLWDTENGPYFGDEINLVEPGFNSGSDKIFGIWKNDGFDYKLTEGNTESKADNYVIVNETHPDDLIYKGKGHYNLPKFLWDKTVAPTALLFLDSKTLGSKYENDIFIGSVKGGKLFHFELNNLRNGLNLEGVLSDKVATNKDEFGNILFAEGFNYITDLKVGPEDGYLYIVSGFKAKQVDNEKVLKTGTVFRIVPIETTIKEDNEEIEKPPLARVFPKINVLNDLSPKLEETPKIDTNILNQLAPKPSKTPKLDVKAWDDLLKQTQGATIDERMVKLTGDEQQQMQSNNLTEKNISQTSKNTDDFKPGDQIILQGSASSVSKEYPGEDKPQTHQVAVLLPPRDDKSIYSGTIILTTTKPIDILSLNDYELNKNILSNMSESFGTFTTIPSTANESKSYIGTTIATLDKKNDFGYDLSIPFLGNSIELHNTEDKPFIAAYTVRADILKSEDVQKIKMVP